MKSWDCWIFDCKLFNHESIVCRYDVYKFSLRISHCLLNFLSNSFYYGLPKSILGTDHLTWGGGLFRSEIFFRTTRELEYLFFPEFNIRLYDKNSESDYFFFLHQIQNIFFSNIGNQNIFLGKKHNPPFKLNGRFLIYKHVYSHIHQNRFIYEYQSGFLPRHSTEHQLLEISNSILKK